MNWLAEIIKSFPNTVRIIIVSAILLGIGISWYVKELWSHEETVLEIMNKYSSEKRSLEIALENCQ